MRHRPLFTHEHRCRTRRTGHGDRVPACYQAVWRPGPPRSDDGGCVHGVGSSSASGAAFRSFSARSAITVISTARRCAAGKAAGRFAARPTAGTRTPRRAEGGTGSVSGASSPDRSRARVHLHGTDPFVWPNGPTCNSPTAYIRATHLQPKGISSPATPSRCQASNVGQRYCRFTLSNSGEDGPCTSRASVKRTRSGSPTRCTELFGRTGADESPVSCSRARSLRQSPSRGRPERPVLI